MEPKGLSDLAPELWHIILNFLPEKDIRKLGEANKLIHAIAQSVLRDRFKFEGKIQKQEFYEKTSSKQKKYIRDIKNPTDAEAYNRYQLKKDQKYPALYNLQKENPLYKKQGLMLDLQGYIESGNQEKALETLRKLEEVDNTWVNSVREAVSQVFHFLKLIKD